MAKRNSELHKRAKAALAISGLSQKLIAKSLGVTEAHFSKIMRGECPLSYMEKLADLLSVSRVWLITGNDSVNPFRSVTHTDKDGGIVTTFPAYEVSSQRRQREAMESPPINENDSEIIRHLKLIEHGIASIREHLGIKTRDEQSAPDDEIPFPEPQPVHRGPRDTP